MINSWTISIPNWQPAKINEWDGCHWSKRAKLKKSDRNIIKHYSKHVPEAAGKRLVKLVIQLGYRQRGGDPDSPWKSLLDALTANKLLVDDNKEYVELAPVEYLPNLSGKDGHTASFITLTEVL